MPKTLILFLVFYIGFIVGFIVLDLIDKANNPLARKCAETQGKYDFCVQIISYEVKQ